MTVAVRSGGSALLASKRLLLVAATTGYQTRAFLEAGRRLGIGMIQATDRCHVLDDPWADQAVPLRFERPRESAEQLTRLVKVDGIVALGDRPAWIAALAAEKMGIPFHPAKAVEASIDKHLARECFSGAGLLTPRHYRISRDCPPSRADFYPCVLKPLGLSASRGVIRANDDAEFSKAAARIRKILQHPDLERLNEPRNGWIQVEQFLEGREFALEGLVTRGDLRILALFDKPDPLDGPFFEETTYVTPSREPPEVQAALREGVRLAVAALGLQNGPVHAEMRWTDAGVFVLEVAPRPIGGLCSRVLRFGDESTLEEIVLRHAVGEELEVPESLAGGVLMIPIPRSGIYRAVTGVEEARRVPGILAVEITAKPGQPIEMLPEGSSYLGFVFAAGNDAHSALREAHSRLAFEIQPALTVTKHPE